MSSDESFQIDSDDLDSLGPPRQQSLDTSSSPPTLPQRTRPPRSSSKLSSDHIPDLWPSDIGSTDPHIVTPVVILREQASLLEAKTKGLVAGRVIRERLGAANKIWLSFYLVAPVLDDYRCHLFRVEHGIDIYPLRLAPSIDLPSGHHEKYLVIGGEGEFLEALQEVFCADKTRRLVKNLVAQSKALSE